MDSLVKQLQQVIPLNFQTMEIKFAPLQTVNLSRTLEMLPTLGVSFAIIPPLLVNHSFDGTYNLFWSGTWAITCQTLIVVGACSGFQFAYQHKGAGGICEIYLI